MSSALEARGRELAKQISDIMNDTATTGAEKSAKLDAIQADYDAHTKEVENSERAAEWTAKLTTEIKSETRKDADDFELPQVEIANPWQFGGRKRLAKEFLASRPVRDQQGLKAKSEFDVKFEIGKKDTTAANNIMQEGGYGSTAPTGAGQNPFAPGAFGPGILPEFEPGIVEQLLYELTIPDIIPSRPASAPIISYLYESVNSMQAEAVAESGLYPFGSNTFARKYEQVGKIAEAMTLSDEAIHDAPELYSFVQGRLLEAVQRQEEVQLLAGSGYPGVNGLLNRASGFTVSSSASLFGATSATGSNVKFPPTAATGAGQVAATISSLAYGRKVTGDSTGVYPTAVEVAENLVDAFTDIKLAVFRNPNIVIMNPTDYLVLRLAKDANGQYFGGSFFGSDYGYGGNVPGLPPNLGRGQHIWNVPVVTTPLMPRYSILTGWFDASVIQAARLQGIAMQMTNSNGTDFVDGNITIRAEERLGLVVRRPSAFELIQLAPGA